jgi:hydroxyacylglutathione hydrolase
MAHVCLFSHGEEPALFCGDTLFNAGVGNCHNGGDPEVLYDTFAKQIARLPDATRVYPGHEYLGRNLEFTLDREPDNKAAAAWLSSSKGQNAAEAPVTTLGEEKDFNTFLRLESPGVIARLRERFPEIGERPSPRTVFLKLRQLRNSW